MVLSSRFRESSHQIIKSGRLHCKFQSIARWTCFFGIMINYFLESRNIYADKRFKAPNQTTALKEP